MKNISIHIFSKNDTLTSLCEKYNCSIETIYILNPIFRYYKPNIGNIIYLPNKDYDYSPYLEKINKLIKQNFISYINKFNDHQLIQLDLEKEYISLGKILSNNDNFLTIFISNINDIFSSYYLFIDTLILKDKNKINEAQKNIENKISNITKFLSLEKINYSIKDISNIVQSRLLIIAKLINNNYYDVYKL